MSLLAETIAAIEPLDERAASAAGKRLDSLTKPLGSLGYLEELVRRCVAIRRDGDATMGQAAMLVFVADHGVGEEGVSPYPQKVTEQMLRNFVRGGAAISVLARHFGYQLRVIDGGVKADTSVEGFPSVIYRRVSPGTRNFTREPAMTEAQVVTALEGALKWSIAPPPTE
jgi:nicotinate-nucleotide--dimethylbenzimidazole phosphoribosyltransferase